MHYIYKTINLINGKYYIGKHKGKLQDNYLGSGIAIKHAIEKYGKGNFKKEVLIICSTEEEANQWEKSIISENIMNSECYNLAPGGEGGYVTKYFTQEEKALIVKKATQSRKEWVKNNPELVKAQQNRQKESLNSNIENHKRAVKGGLSLMSVENKQEQHKKISKSKLEKGYYKEFQLINEEGNIVMCSIGAEAIAKRYNVTGNGIRLAAKKGTVITRGVLKGHRVTTIK